MVGSNVELCVELGDMGAATGLVGLLGSNLLLLSIDLDCESGAGRKSSSSLVVLWPNGLRPWNAECGIGVRVGLWPRSSLDFAGLLCVIVLEGLGDRIRPSRES